MSNDNAKARSIFLSAVEQHAPDQWAEYLDDACREDVALRQRVEQLLRAHQGEDSFLDRGDDGATIITDRPIAETPGTLIGPYKLLQQIGEGGFGVVFLAEQQRPVKRRVALKIIKPGMDTREVIARFEAERQALALMDHPNIAKVLDAGATETGRPYFVMELVQGIPITEYCDQCNLTPGERLALFVTVCQAVQHAHQKGVIHRDIKPTNILVAIQDGRPEPKIIDFGVAKAINQQLTQHTLMTAFAQIVGTPLYMSPEQAEMSALGVDTRSDIYSLGVLLYELLTGTTPFEGERLRQAAYDELRRIIREEEPPRPSARLSTLAADLVNTVAEHRRTDVRRLRQTVRGELDWIVMKCLEKDRTRRYDSAGSLARDVERYLQDEPVQACPPSIPYRLKKFVRRNKIAAAFVLILLASVAALTVSNIQTRQSERRAVAESAKAKAVSDLLQEMIGSANAEPAQEIHYTVRELLDDFSARLGSRLADQREVLADIHATIGRAYRNLKLPDKAQPHIEQAIEIQRQVDDPHHRKLAALLVDYGANFENLTKVDEAEVQLRNALDIYRAEQVTGAPVMHALRVLEHVMSSSSTDQTVAAESIYKQALAMGASSDEERSELASLLNLYAGVLNKHGRFEESEKVARQAIELHRQVNGDQHAWTAAGLRALGNALRGQQRLEEAEAVLRENLRIVQLSYPYDHVYVKWSLDDLKKVLEARGDKPALDQLANEANQQAMRSASPEYDIRLARLLVSDNSKDKDVEAHRLIRRAIERYDQMAVDSRVLLWRRGQAAEGFVGIARDFAADPRFADEVNEAHRRLTAELEGMLASFPNSTACLEQVGYKYRSWAFAVAPHRAFLSQVEHDRREAIKQFEKLSRDDPKRPGVWFLLANTYAWHGDALRSLERLNEAAAAFGRTMEIYDQHAADIAQDPTPGRTSDVTGDYLRIASFLADTHREKQAAEFFRKALAFNDGSGMNPNDSADALYYLALAQLRAGDTVSYRATCKTVVQIPLEKLDGNTKSRPVWTPCIGPDALDDSNLLVKLAEELVVTNSLTEPHFGLQLLGAAHYRAGQYQQAAERLEQSIAVYSASAVPGRDTTNYQRLLLAMTKWQLGQRDEARKLLAETLPAVEKELQSPSSSWNRRATLEVLRAEAEALIKPKEADDSTNNNPMP